MKQRKTKKISASEVMQAISSIKTLIKEGWSISYAKKSICGGINSKLYLEVINHPEYLRVLNYYLNKTRGDMVYKRNDNGKLVCITKEERDSKCFGAQ